MAAPALDLKEKNSLKNILQNPIVDNGSGAFYS